MSRGTSQHRHRFIRIPFLDRLWPFSQGYLHPQHLSYVRNGVFSAFLAEYIATFLQIFIFHKKISSLPFQNSTIIAKKILTHLRLQIKNPRHIG